MDTEPDLKTDDTVTTEITESPPQVSRIQRRNVRECHFVPSDRMQLIQQANDLLHTFMIKQSSEFSPNAQLTDSETRTQEAALKLLREQFSHGPRDSETVDKVSDTDQCTEWHEPKPEAHHEPT